VHGVNISDANKIKIFVVSPFYWTMGEGKGISVVNQTIEGFVRNNFEVHLFVPNNVTMTQNSMQKIYIHYFHFHLSKYPNKKYIGVIFQKISWLSFIISATIQMLKTADKIKPQIIYGISSYGAPVAFIISKIYSIPNVTRLYGTFLYPYISSPIRLFSCFNEASAFIIPATSIIITDDGTFGNLVAKKLNVPNEKIKFWLNGVDKENENLKISNEEKTGLKKKFHIPYNKKIIVSISRLVNWKKVDRLINSIPEIVAKRDDVIFLIVGDGNERVNLQNLVNDLNINKYVIFTGSISREDVMKILKISDIFVSLYDLSNLGNPLIEAMISGKCIITLNTGDTGKVIKNMQNGILLEMTDLFKIPEIVNKLLSDDALRTTLGLNAKIFADEKFENWNERIDKECDLIKSMVIDP